MPAGKGSLCSSFSFSLSPSLPVTRQPFNVECQGDGDVTLPAGWRPLHRTRVQRQRKALSDYAPLGARLPRFPCTHTFCGGGDTLPQSGPHSTPAPPRRGLSAISSRQYRNLRSARLSPARWIRGPAWMLRLRAPSEDGPAATRLKTSRAYQVLPKPAGPESAPS